MEVYRQWTMSIWVLYAFSINGNWSRMVRYMHSLVMCDQWAFMRRKWDVFKDETFVLGTVAVNCITVKYVGASANE